MITHLLLLSCVYVLGTVTAQERCQNKLPKATGEWKGSWQYYQDSENEINFAENGDIGGSNDYKGGRCEDILIYKNATATSAFYHGNMVVSRMSGGSRCYGCFKIEQRTENVIEIKMGQCIESSAAVAMQRCDIANPGSFIQLFRTSPIKINCKNTFEGEFQFTYEYTQNEGICNHPENRISACQEPGSGFKDNEVFSMVYKKCPGLDLSRNEVKEYQCLGSWKDPYKKHNVYSAIYDTGANLFQDKFRCLLTEDDQRLANNQRRYTMSSKPTCAELISDYEGPERILTTPAITTSQYTELQPGCMLPQNFSGSWFTSSQYDSKVNINSTHIHFDTLYSTFYSVETFFTCQQTRDTRFLMKQVTKGRCEVDYVCFEFLPRHQNIIRFRMGKPFRARADFTTSSSLREVFKTACSWSAFTVSRTENLNYVYQTFILNPPAPVECPIGGIYNFTQTGEKDFKYYTKIRGVTERPRVSYHCDNAESEFKVCAGNPKTVNLDVERCASVDHVGRPIGEYDEPDNFLQCVGYWQENQKSYLVTYDTEDPVSNFRCWVYERMGWKDIRMSRALRAACGSLQTPRSASDVEGASLSLELVENEREFDQCPQKFLDGRDPYMKSNTIYVVAAASSHSISISVILFTSLLTIYFYH